MVGVRRRSGSSETVKGEGLSANVDGKQVQIGNRRMADKHGWIEPPKAGEEEASLLSAADEWEAEANTVCWVAIDGKLAAVFGVADKIRDEAEEAIKQLRANDVRISCECKAASWTSVSGT